MAAKPTNPKPIRARVAGSGSGPPLLVPPLVLLELLELVLLLELLLELVLLELELPPELVPPLVLLLELVPSTQPETVKALSYTWSFPLSGSGHCSIP